MSKMFDSYDNPESKQECSHEIEIDNVILLKNIKHEIIGAKAKFNSVFTLYFKLVGEDKDLSTLLSVADFDFEITSIKTHDKVLTIVPTKYDMENDAIIIELLASEATGLVYGIYNMRLFMTIDEVVYDLYNANDGILMVE